ncbi:hypothetical protein FHS14_001395 [Paenibacillus baekrokdamisoli]|uniref:hypothetical protein n=1 Tax=Paenibacillus baekrokdamisoli TaxID=1712516 RepID=UPI0013DE89F1|nr:hypothetical protein [Paenibacillus baekrokdamisoli]MBB3068419.1 hypothetical protein [Paenibacillus baekrokdamisoli]
MNKPLSESLRSAPMLHEVFRDHFLIGAAVNPCTLVEQRDLLLQHFNRDEKGIK